MDRVEERVGGVEGANHHLQQTIRRLKEVRDQRNNEDLNGAYEGENLDRTKVKINKKTDEKNEIEEEKQQQREAVKEKGTEKEDEKASEKEAVEEEEEEGEEEEEEEEEEDGVEAEVHFQEVANLGKVMSWEQRMVFAHCLKKEENDIGLVTSSMGHVRGGSRKWFGFSGRPVLRNMDLRIGLKANNGTRKDGPKLMGQHRNTLFTFYITHCLNYKRAPNWGSPNADARPNSCCSLTEDIQPSNFTKELHQIKEETGSRCFKQ